MRTVFYSWRFPEVMRSTVSAERRSAAAELRQLRRHLHNARQIVEAALGAGSVLKDGPAGEATASSDRLATVRGLADRLVPLVGRSHWGVGTTLKEAAEAAEQAEARRCPVLVWSSGMSAGLRKAEPARPGALDLARVEAALREHADRHEQKKQEAERAAAREEADRRSLAASALLELRSSGRLEQMQQQSPETYMEVRALMDAAQAALVKGGTFHGLPLPRKVRQSALPPGTKVGGRMKVETPDGEKWRSARQGLVADEEAERNGGSVGHATGSRRAV